MATHINVSPNLDLVSIQLFERLRDARAAYARALEIAAAAGERADLRMVAKGWPGPDAEESVWDTLDTDAWLDELNATSAAEQLGLRMRELRDAERRLLIRFRDYVRGSSAFRELPPEGIEEVDAVIGKALGEDPYLSAMERAAYRHDILKLAAGED